MQMISDLIETKVQGGVQVRGCFRHSLSGTHYTIYILGADCSVLATQHLGVAGDCERAREVLDHEIARVRAGLEVYRIWEVKEPVVQTAACQYVLRVLFPRKVRVTRAA